MLRHVSALDQLSIQDAWLTIGSFDGVHLGHQEIIHRLTAGAHRENSPAVVLTFYPHPATVLRSLQSAISLTLPDERAEILEKQGVDVVITLPFNTDFAATSAQDFITSLKKATGFNHLLVGQDFALGHNREGDVRRLGQWSERYGYQLVIIPPLVREGRVISSSQIRVALADGEVETAASLMGRPYQIEGSVVRGDGRGRRIGIPTANLRLHPDKLIPKLGVYACLAEIGGEQWAAATNIGVRPTFDGKSLAPQVEAHLLDFNADIYEQNVRLKFMAYLREEQRFSSVEALLEQIQTDIQKTRLLVKPNILVP